MNKYELTNKEYKRALKMNDNERLEKNICPVCLHKMIDGICLIHGTKEQIMMFKI